jgi:hypothetical protein
MKGIRNRTYYILSGSICVSAAILWQQRSRRLSDDTFQLISRARQARLALIREQPSLPKRLEALAAIEEELNKVSHAN